MSARACSNCGKYVPPNAFDGYLFHGDGRPAYLHDACHRAVVKKNEAADPAGTARLRAIEAERLTTEGR